MKTNGKLHSASMMYTLVSLALALAGTGYLRTIEADSTQMRQLFHNLIGNALKVHRPGVPPVIRVENDLLCDPINGPRNSD